eukprot:sb/3475943/
MSVHQISEEAQLEDIILDNPEKLVVADFYASWCGPCSKITPKLNGLAGDDKYKDTVVFVKVDVDDAEPEFLEKMEVNAMPTFRFFKNGSMDPIDLFIGAIEPKLRAVINKNMPKPGESSGN